MALGIDFGSITSGDGDTLFAAFTKINNMFTTTTKLSNGDMVFGRNDGIKVGKGGGTSYGGTAIGQNALNSASAGLDNTAVGWSVLENSIGNYNTAVGSNAMKNSSGSNANGNTAVGAGALQSTTGGNNTCVGLNSLLSNTSGNDNVGVGGGTLYSNLIRTSNTAIGTNALSTNTLYSNCTGLGANASFLNGDNQVQLGDSSTTTYVYNTVNSRSDLRDKTEVRDTVLGLDFINELRPVDYKWDMREDYRPEKPIDLELDATEEEKDAYKIAMDEWLESCRVENLNHDGTHTRTRYHHGLIAQEVKEVIDASGVDFGGFQDHKVNGGGDVLSLGYSELIAPMIKAIQELTARINVLEGN